MTQPTQPLDLDAIEARAAAATRCPEAVLNGRQDGQHTWRGSMTHLRCELCGYTRPRGERAEEAAAMADEIRRLRAQLAAVTALCDEQEMAARLFEFPTPDWVDAVRRAIEDAPVAPATARP
jgi:hypothetical protein